MKLAPHIALTDADFRFIVQEQLKVARIESGPILIVTVAKNITPTILAASLFALKKANAELFMVPWDHMIQDTSALHTSNLNVVSSLDDGKFVLFGIAPTRPETGYGYLESDG